MHYLENIANIGKLVLSYHYRANKSCDFFLGCMHALINIDWYKDCFPGKDKVEKYQEFESFLKELWENREDQ